MEVILALYTKFLVYAVVISTQKKKITKMTLRLKAIFYCSRHICSIVNVSMPLNAIPSIV